jgi:hypothetical protein
MVCISMATPCCAENISPILFWKAWRGTSKCLRRRHFCPSWTVKTAASAVKDEIPPLAKIGAARPSHRGNDEGVPLLARSSMTIGLCNPRAFV